MQTVRRSNSRSPSPAPPGQFFPPDATSTMATPEQLATLRNELRDEIRAELRRETAAAAAQIPDAIKRKPKIPQFDKANIEVWIRRTENAFTRATISTPQEKFAFLETKFPCSFNPRINEYLWGEATPEKYKEFLDYLRKEYGPTKQLKASIIIDGFKRDGRKPSQYAAALNEKTKDITIEDIKKEMLVREMPIETRRMLQERIEGLSFQEAAVIADAYFDQEGRPRFQNTSINHIQDTELENDSPDDDGINAVNLRRKPNFASTKPIPSQGLNCQTTRGWHAQTAYKPTRGWHAQTANKPRPSYIPTNPGLCFYHDRHGERAKRCEVWCEKFVAGRFPGNERAGHR